VPVRLFYDFLMEEELRASNPVGRGRYTPDRRAGGHERGLVPRLARLPWIPSEPQWLRILEVARREPIRNRVMLALAYDAALRREELCALRTDDLDPAHRTLRVRAETTKNRRERIMPYSASTGVLLQGYLAHRAGVSRARGPVFLSESRRNHAQPLTLWTWSKVVRRIALAASVERFSTHTTRHLRRARARGEVRLDRLQPGDAREASSAAECQTGDADQGAGARGPPGAEREDPELHLFLRLGAATGLRPGEVCALWWQDFDLEAGEMIVGYNVVHAKGLPDGYVRKRTKSRHGDDRPIALGTRTLRLLAEHRARCESRAREWGGELAPDAYVFSADEAGRRPLRVDSMTRRFGELVADLGHGYTLYGFRHFVATQLGAVATTATIHERMGHGSLEVTGGYVHRVSEADREAARYMDDLLDNE
jgi:integrase